MVWLSVLYDEVKLLYSRYPQTFTYNTHFFPWLTKSVLGLTQAGHWLNWYIH